MSKNNLKFPKKFRPVVQYTLRKGVPQKIELLDEKLWEKVGVVYARIVYDEVLYIGSTNGPLKTRLNAHLKGIEKVRSEKGKEYWKFVEGKKVTIYAYKPMPLKELGYEISTHRGLEEALIKEFQPRFTHRI